MKFLFVFLVVFVILAIVGFLLKNQGKARRNDDGPWPFFAKKLLSPPEQVLYHRLVSALPDQVVLAQVQLSRVLGVKKGFKSQEWNNKISRMSLDFLVCQKDSSAVAAIELDDRTHAREIRQEADARKERALAAAGVPLIRWQATALPDESTIRQAVLSSTAVATTGPSPAKSRIATQKR